MPILSGQNLPFTANSLPFDHTIFPLSGEFAVRRSPELLTQIFFFP